MVEFLLQMVVGVTAGATGGWLLLAFMRRVPLPDEGLYPLRVLAVCPGHLRTGGGGAPVRVPGGVCRRRPDRGRAGPCKGEIARFHSSLARLAELYAFVMLGLTVRLYALPRGGAWLIGLALAVLLAFAIRPLLVGLLLVRVRLRAAERLFVLWSGLKGAVPILLGAFIVQARVTDAPRAYEIIFVVVAFSVIVQGGTMPALARQLKIPLRTIEPEPWSLGVRFQEEPEDLHRLLVVAGSAADGTSVSDLPLTENAWICLIIRGGRLVPVRARTVLQEGDELLVLAPWHGYSRTEPAIHVAARAQSRHDAAARATRRRYPATSRIRRSGRGICAGETAVARRCPPPSAPC